MNEVTLEKAVDAWTNQTNPANNNSATIRLQIQNAATADDKYAWLYFTLPFPLGSVITSATLGLWTAQANVGSFTVNAKLAAAKWILNQISWDDQPAVTADAAATSPSLAAGPTNRLMTMDLTNFMNVVSQGQAWFGVRVASSSAELMRFYSAQAAEADFRPYLNIQWVEASEQPDNLRPGDGLAVSKQYSTYVYEYVDQNGADQNAQQFRFFATQADADAQTPIAFDTGTDATTISQYDSSVDSGSWAGLADNATVWYRCRARDVGNQWTPWSDPTSHTRRSKGVLTITTTSLRSGSPQIAWTFTGRTQEQYRILIAKANKPGVYLWDSGWVVSTVTARNIPFGIVHDDGTYRITVQILDTWARDAVPGDNPWVTATTDLAISYDAGTSGVSAFAFASDPLLPIGRFTWTRSVAPNGGFYLLQSLDGGATWKYVEEIDPADALVSGTSYAWRDNLSAPYKTNQWRLVAVVNNIQSNASVVSGTVRRLAPFLYRENGVDAVCFLNPQRSMGFSDLHGVHEPLAGPSVVVTQRLGKRKGHVAGRFAPEGLGVTAEVQLERFLRMRLAVGEPMYLAIANESYKVIAYNFTYDILTDGSGITYFAEFDWVEV